MRLGIDFGTTHTVAAVADRGNYPIVGFEWGDAMPSLVAARGTDGALRFGQDAAQVASDPAWTVLRSFKRLVARSGPQSQVTIGERSYGLPELLAGYLKTLHDDVRRRSNAGARPDEPLQVVVSVPANATNDQRFLTLDAFQEARFDVVAMLNEPSAAGFEYAHRYRNTLTSRREYVLVYDLGGGTFDSSLIHMAGAVNEVITSCGVPELGGDDLDAAILDLALRTAGVPSVAPEIELRLLEVCRLQKEAVGPNTRRLVIDLDPVAPPVVLPMDAVCEVCAPLVERTIEALDETMRNPRREAEEVSWNEVASLYVAGGASGFPLIPRLLKERFGSHRVRRSPYPFAATAVGLATFLDEGKGFELADCLTRHFGVWRESEAGAAVCFDPIFPKDTRLPRRGERPLETVRRYRAAHNLGYFRFVECGRLRNGLPDGHVVPWDEIRFPFEAALRGREDLSAVPVARIDGGGCDIEEHYRCNELGVFEVTLSVPGEGFSRSYRIGRQHGAPPRPPARTGKPSARPPSARL